MIKGSKPIIDWEKCYNHLLEVKDAFRKDLLNSVLEKFYPKNASLVSIDDCVSENFESDFCFFDKDGKVYYFLESIDKDENYIFFDWKKINRKDNQRLLYSKSARRKLIAQDREQDEPMLLSEQQIERVLSSSLKPRLCDKLLPSGFYDDGSFSDNLSAFGESSDMPEEVKEVVPKNSIHSENVYLFLHNYPPHFSFRMDADWNATNDKRTELNILLDGLAKQYNLRHYRARYIYNTHSVKNKDGKSLVLIDSVIFKKTPCNHMFKPYYDTFKI